MQIHLIFNISIQNSNEIHSSGRNVDTFYPIKWAVHKQMIHILGLPFKGYYVRI
jgi:hypothetical protein